MRKLHDISAEDLGDFI